MPQTLIPGGLSGKVSRGIPLCGGLDYMNVVSLVGGKALREWEILDKLTLSFVFSSALDLF